MKANLRLTGLIVLVLATLVLGACAGPAAPAQGPVAGFVKDGIAAVDVWARPAEAGGTTAVYMSIRNDSDKADALIGVAAPDVTDEAMLHETKMVDNVMMMDHVHQIDLAPGETVELKSGGLHIMLMEVKRELNSGDTISLTLEFEQLGEVTILVPVKDQ